MKRWKMYLLLIVAIVFLGVSGYLGFQGNQPQEVAEPTAPVTVEVTRGDIKKTVTAPGRLVWTDTANVSFANSGLVIDVMVRPGDWVETDQALLLVDMQSSDGSENVELLALMDGVVLEVNVVSGDWVRAGAVAVKLTNPTALEVVATVIEEDLPIVEVGQPVELFFDALPELILDSQVTRIVPETIPGDRPLYRIYTNLDEVPQGLVSGMTADASIIVAARTDVLRLPRALIRARSDGRKSVV